MNIEEFSTRALDTAQAAGIAPAEIAVSRSESFSVCVRLGKIENYQVEDTLSVTMRGKCGERIGTASTQALDEDSIAMLVQGVRDSAALIETDEQDAIEPPDAHYGEVVNYSEKIDAISAQQKIALAMDIDRRLTEADARLVPYHTAVASGANTFIMKNTLGLNLSHSSNMIYAYAQAVARDGERTATGGKLLWGYDLDAVKAEDVAGGAAEDALAKLHAGRMKSGAYAAVIENSAMGSLLSTFAGIFSANMAQKGMSLLAGREGQKIAADCVTIVDDPLMPWGMGSCPFDREGAAAMTKEVVSGGVLKTLLHNRKTAKKAGCATTGNAAGGGSVQPTNFYIKPGADDLDALLSQMGDGLLVTEVTGLHAGANPISGDFSLLSKGFEVKGGKRVRAVEQFTVAGNFYKLLAGVRAVGSDLLFEGSPIGCPSVLVDSVSVAGE